MRTPIPRDAARLFLLVIAAFAVIVATFCVEERTALAAPDAGAGGPTPLVGDGGYRTDLDEDGGAPPANADGGLLNPPEPPVLRVPPTEAEKAEGSPIADHRLGQPPHRQGRRHQLLREKVGQLFHTEALTQDVRALWDSGFFDDIEVDLDAQRRGRRPPLPRPRAAEHQGDRVLRQRRARQRQAATRRSRSSRTRSSACRRCGGASRRSRTRTPRRATSSPTSTTRSIPQRDNEVIVKFKITEHQPVTRPARHLHRQRARLRRRAARRACRPATGASSRSARAAPYRQDVFERDVLLLSALYYDKGYLSVQIGTPRVMLTPDREGIDITIVDPRGAPLQDPAAHASTSATTTARRSSRSAAGARCAQMIRAQSGDWFNRAELVKDLAGRAHALPRRRLRQRRGRARDRARPRARGGRHRRPHPARAAGAHRAHRGEGQHQDARQGHPPRDGASRRGSSSARPKLENSKRRITALGYFERVDVSTEQGSAPDKIIINFEVEREADRHVPGRRGLQLGRELHRHRAGAAGQPLRQRAVARAPGAGLGAAAARHAALLRALLPRLALELEHGALRHSSTSSRTSRAGRVGGSLTFGYALIQPVAAPRASPAPLEWDSVDTSPDEHVLRGDRPGFSSVFQQLPAREPLQRRARVSLRPTHHATTRATTASSRRPASSSRPRPSSRATSLGQRRSTSSATALTGRFYYPLGGGRRGSPARASSSS